MGAGPLSSGNLQNWPKKFYIFHKWSKEFISINMSQTTSSDKNTSLILTKIPLSNRTISLTQISHSSPVISHNTSESILDSQHHQNHSQDLKSMASLKTLSFIACSCFMLLLCCVSNDYKGLKSLWCWWCGWRDAYRKNLVQSWQNSCDNLPSMAPLHLIRCNRCVLVTPNMCDMHALVA